MSQRDKESWYEQHKTLFPWGSPYWKQNIAANAIINQNKWAIEGQANIMSAGIPYVRAGINTFFPKKTTGSMFSTPSKRQRTEQGHVTTPAGTCSFAGGVTKNSEELGGITATGTIRGGGSSSPLTISINNNGKKWVKEFEDRRTSAFEKFFSPYWFYTYLLPNVPHVIEQDTTGLGTSVEKVAQVVETFGDYDIGKIDQMARVTPAIGATLTTDNRSSSGWQGIHNAMNGWGNSNSDAIFKVPLIQKRLTFRNCGNRRCHLKVYEFTCIKNCKLATNRPTVLWANYLDRKALTTANEVTIGAYDTAITGVSCQACNLPSTTDLGRSPLCKDVNDFWKCTGKVNGYVLPGRNLEWVTTDGPKHINRMNFDQYNADGLDAVAGWTKEYIVIAHGDSVAGLLPNNDVELSAKSDFKMIWTEDEQFVASYTYKEPTVKHYITSSLISNFAPLGGLPAGTVGLANQKGVALTDTALQDNITDPYDNNEFI